MSIGDTPLIKLTNATLAYDRGPVLSDVSLTIGRNDVAAILGSNGSGKSTLVRGILGLCRLVDGDIELFGVPAARFHERHRIGFVPQRNQLVGTIPVTVTEVVESGRIARRSLFGRFGSDDRAAVERALETVGLADLGRRPVQELSGGQQRRVSIARALAAEPELLILDEPTAGVDAETQVRLADTLRHLRDEGTTIVLIEHELGIVADLIDRVIVMGHGAIVYDGPPDDAHTHHADHEHHTHDSEPLRPGTGLMGW